MADYGTDIFALDDMSADLRTVSGIALLIQEAYHRITQEDLIDQQAWGINLADEVGRAVSANDVQAIGLKVAEAIQRDDRFASVTVASSSEVDGDTISATYLIDCVAVDGVTFNFVVTSDGLTVDIMNGDVTGTS